MEPETLATPSDPSAGASARGPMSGPSVQRTAIDGAPLLEAGLPAPRVHGDTLRNGGSHTNGHARPGAEAWTLPFPGRAGIAHGGASLVPVLARHDGFYLRYGKRLLDILGALLAMLVLAPVMVIVSILIKLESRGPVMYRSTRIGKDGRPFQFLKFRSMMDGADRHRHQLSHLNEMDGPTFKISRDPRVTRVGRLLRVSSIDEIPQFLNVLRGEMSLVGPRPPIPEEVAQYEPWQCRRLDVRPGITCLWQISGRSTLSFKEWMRLDLEYIKHQSFWLDVRILLRTIPAVLSREGAY